MTVDEALAETPIVAIVRGVRPDEVVDVAEVLHDAGIRVIEVPMNSPEPLESLLRLKAVEGRMVYGAGTVLRPGAVDAVVQAGGRIVVAPNTDIGVIRRAVERGATPIPGFATATEAFEALEAGARLLKLFPASTYGPAHLAALRAVLPGDAVVQPVGGVRPQDMADWWAAGARGFGLGGELYKPGRSMAEIRDRAAKAVATVRALP